MKTTKKIQIEVIDTITCNNCGLTKPTAEFTGLEEVSVKGHFVSEVLNDETKYTFSLCEHCLKELFDGFQYPVEEVEYNDFLAYP